MRRKLFDRLFRGASYRRAMRRFVDWMFFDAMKAEYKPVAQKMSSLNRLQNSASTITPDQIAKVSEFLRNDNPSGARMVLTKGRKRAMEELKRYKSDVPAMAKAKERALMKVKEALVLLNAVKKQQAIMDKLLIDLDLFVKDTKYFNEQRSHDKGGKAQARVLKTYAARAEKLGNGEMSRIAKGLAKMAVDPSAKGAKVRSECLKLARATKEHAKALKNGFDLYSKELDKVVNDKISANDDAKIANQKIKSLEKQVAIYNETAKLLMQLQKSAKQGSAEAKVA